MIRDLRMHWDATLGWLIDSAKGLMPSEITRAIDYTMKVQTQRFASLPPGERKDECWRTILDLRARKVHVNIAGTGERVLFDAYKSDKKYWYPALEVVQ